MKTKLKEIRNQKNITQAELCALAEISPMTLYFAERGVRILQSTKVKIARILEVPVAEIWCEDEPGEK